MYMNIQCFQHHLLKRKYCCISPQPYDVSLEPLLRVVWPYAGLIFWLFLLSQWSTFLSILCCVVWLLQVQQTVYFYLSRLCIGVLYPQWECERQGLYGGFNSRRSIKDITLIRHGWHSCKRNNFCFPNVNSEEIVKTHGEVMAPHRSRKGL